MRVILVAPTGHGVGLTSVCLGLLRAFDRAGARVAYAKPVAQPMMGEEDRSPALARLIARVDPPPAITPDEAERLLASGAEQELMERAVAACATGHGADVLVVEALVPGHQLTWSTRINRALASALDAEVVLVSTVDRPADELARAAEIAGRVYGERCLGCIINRVPAAAAGAAVALSPAAAFAAHGLRVLAAVPVSAIGRQPRVVDLARAIGATAVHPGEWMTRRVRSTPLCARTLANVIPVLTPGALVVTPGDRDDIVAGVCLAALDGRRLAGLLLTGGFSPSPAVLELCRPALEAGLPLLATTRDSYDTVTALSSAEPTIATDDRERAEAVANAVADALDPAVVAAVSGAAVLARLSPAAFRHRLIERARAANMRIVLPEGDEPRTIAAAAICARRGLARCVLLGEPGAVHEAARRAGVELSDGVEVLDPATVAARYVDALVTLRAGKGVTRPIAEEQLQDPIVVGTMMLKLDEVDGLVSGAVHTTAHTIRPALQLIRTAPGQSLVSSVFFMCLPDQVLVYGDCAINPDPTAEQLAEIALQSADSAVALGIEPRVAMISYSTGASGSGAGVDKVREATRLARLRRPGLLIDGPLQYDAAANPGVAKAKAPNSPVAGRATVFVFPDLNTGNTTYKAVQRSADVVSVGPMLQGLAKPVNDLSRGATVEDIVYTIALTAMQAAALRSEIR